MANDQGRLTLEHLKAIRADTGEIKLKLDELTSSQGGLRKIAASKSDSLLRLDRRVEGIERRLELVEADA